MQEGKPEVTKVVAFVKNGEIIPSVSSPLKILRMKDYICIQSHYIAD